MLAAPQPLYAGGTMSMKVCGKSGTYGIAKVGVRRIVPGVPHCWASSSITFTAMVNLDARQQGLSDVATAFRVCFMLMMLHCSQHQYFEVHAVLLYGQWAHHQHSQTEVTVFLICTWKVAGQSFTYLGMFFHENRQIKHAIWAQFSRACASQGPILSRYFEMEAATFARLLMQL